MLRFYSFLGLVVLFLANANTSIAQCAMCRATLETNVSNGSQEQFASTLNFGIMYLFVAPYLLVAIVGYIWYKQSRKANT
ncbi:MAG: hypothetical protein L3J29_12260 [Cyclobacteriaceae bacterium]|nr:hypothetical protein [Cyclobacteriaceae bacterium]